MKTLHFLGLALCFGLPGTVALPAGPADGAAQGESVKLMTFNILHSLNPLPPTAWRYRRPLVWHVIRAHRPDVIALQEVLSDQLDDFVREFGQEFDWVGHGHGGPRSGEILPVAWRRDRFERVRHEFFWLSPTPEKVGSSGWGGRFPRVATLVQLREIATGREFVLVNNHWEADNDLMEAREHGARLVLRRTAGTPAGCAVFLAGDFNIVPTRAKRREPYRLLTEVGTHRFQDAWLAAAERHGPDTTTTRLHPAPNLQAGERKDWILFRGPVQAARVTVDDFHHDRLYPSDHLPVMLEFIWKTD